MQLFSFQNDGDLYDSADYAGPISPSRAAFPNNPMNNWNWLANGTYLATNTSWALENYVLRPNVTVQKVRDRQHSYSFTASVFLQQQILIAV